jgi:NAD(P)-dependent dehydrogenase (short-subunit alcohol dehydrogenase family)
MELLHDKIALITGAGSGIGRAAALLFAQHGASVVLAEFSEQAGHDAVEEIHAAGGQTVFVPEPSRALRLRVTSAPGDAQSHYGAAIPWGCTGTIGWSLSTVDRAAWPVAESGY